MPRSMRMDGRGRVIRTGLSVPVSIGVTVDVGASAEEIEKAMLDEVVAQGVIAGVPVTKKQILYDGTI